MSAQLALSLPVRVTFAYAPNDDAAMEPWEIRVRYHFVANSLTRARREELFEVLSPEEKRRLARFEFENDRCLFLEAHALLRRTLSSLCPIDAREWRFQATSQGRPELASHHAEDLRFSLTHTRGLVACVVCRKQDVGIDAEEIRGDLLSQRDWGRILSAREHEALAACEPAVRTRRLFESWTLKEAFFKGLGHGLTEPPDSIAVRFHPGKDPDVSLVAADRDLSAWRFALVPVHEDYVLAVAIRFGSDLECDLLIHAEAD